MVGVAQLVRVLDCGSRCRRFEPGHPPNTKTVRQSLAVFLLVALNALHSKAARKKTGIDCAAIRRF